MDRDEKVIIKTSQFPRDLLEKMYADIKKNSPREIRPTGEEMKIQNKSAITLNLAPIHHQLSAIMNRVEKAKAERTRQEQQNPQSLYKKCRPKP